MDSTRTTDLEQTLIILIFEVVKTKNGNNPFLMNFLNERRTEFLSVRFLFREMDTLEEREN